MNSATETAGSMYSRDLHFGVAAGACSSSLDRTYGFPAIYVPFLRFINRLCIVSFLSNHRFDSSIRPFSNINGRIIPDYLAEVNLGYIDIQHAEGLGRLPASSRKIRNVVRT